jgi:hypothetical protein
MPIVDWQSINELCLFASQISREVCSIVFHHRCFSHTAKSSRVISVEDWMFCGVHGCLHVKVDLAYLFSRLCKSP